MAISKSNLEREKFSRTNIKKLWLILGFKSIPKTSTSRTYGIRWGMIQSRNSIKNSLKTLSGAWSQTWTRKKKNIFWRRWISTVMVKFLSQNSKVSSSSIESPSLPNFKIKFPSYSIGLFPLMRTQILSRIKTLKPSRLLLKKKWEPSFLNWTKLWRRRSSLCSRCSTLTIAIKMGN